MNEEKESATEQENLPDEQKQGVVEEETSDAGSEARYNSYGGVVLYKKFGFN